MYTSKKRSLLDSNETCGVRWCRLESLNPSLSKFRPEPVSFIHTYYYLLDCIGDRNLVLPTVNDNKAKTRCDRCIYLFYILCNHRHK